MSTRMRALPISLAVAAILFLATNGHLLLIPLLFVPLGLFNLRRSRQSLAAVRAHPPDATNGRPG